MEDTNLFINMIFSLKLYYGDAHTCSATKDAVLPLKISASGTVGTGLCQGRFVLNYHQLRGSTILWLVCVEVGESRRERWREHSWQLMLVGQMRLSSGSVLMRCSAKVHEQRERPLSYLETTHRNVLTYTHIAGKWHCHLIQMQTHWQNPIYTRAQSKITVYTTCTRLFTRTYTDK